MQRAAILRVLKISLKADSSVNVLNSPITLTWHRIQRAKVPLVSGRESSSELHAQC